MLWAFCAILRHGICHPERSEGSPGLLCHPERASRRAGSARRFLACQASRRIFPALPFAEIANLLLLSPAAQARNSPGPKEKPTSCHCEPVRTLVWQSVSPVSRLAVSGKRCGLTLSLAFSEGCGTEALPSSAAGSGRALVPYFPNVYFS